MSYKPAATLDTTVGERRAWNIDTEALDTLLRIEETLDRIHQQLAVITGMDLSPGESK